MQYSQILWAAVLCAVLFDEAMTLRTVAGVVITVAAGGVIFTPARPRRLTHALAPVTFWREKTGT